MDIFKNFIKVAKELNKADSNDELGEYIGGKISNLMDKLDGTEEENWEREADEELERIADAYDSEDFDNDVYQAMVDAYIEKYGFLLIGYYRKYAGWNKVYQALDDIRRNGDLEEEERQQLDSQMEEADNECLQYINKAIECLDEEYENWVCTLLCAKAWILYRRGMGVSPIDTEQMVAAVRLAIQALPYACDNDEREEAKSIISGKQEGYDKILHGRGYGISGYTIEQRIKQAEEDCVYCIAECKEDSVEDKESMWEICGSQLEDEIKAIIHGQGTFSNRPYHDRQFIFTVRDIDHIGGCYDETDTIKYVFPLDELPGDITFMGHPLPNTLYYAHPLRPLYLPFENAQLLLFYEKIQEMCRLFQCLGATQITARCLKGHKVSSEIVSSCNMDIEGDYKLLGASGSVNGKSSQLENKANRDEMFLTQTFSPKKAPYCPDDLLWAKNDPELQTFIRQRMEGGLLEFTKKVSSFETSSLSQNQINDVKVAFQSLMANVSVGYSASEDTTFSSTTETEWELSVQFKPLDELDAPSPKKCPLNRGASLMDVEYYICVTDDRKIVAFGTLQENIKIGEKVVIYDEETEYLSSIEGVVMFGKILGEGEAGDKAGLLLTGITSRNIHSGAKICKEGTTASSPDVDCKKENIESPKECNSLSPEEEKYKEEILFCLEDNGAITDEDRKYLERKRRRFGISEERAKEIEEAIQPSLSDDEKEYLETFREIASGGVVTERARRLLERERESLNISKERAAEIEKLVDANPNT